MTIELLGLERNDWERVAQDPEAFAREHKLGIGANKDLLRGVAEQTLTLFQRTSARTHPWSGFLAVDRTRDTIVGTCGFKAPPDSEGVVEIAYFTFPGFVELVRDLAREYPASTHVRDVGLRSAEDRQIWDHARMQGFVIVSKDTDFRETSHVEGFPPKVVWLDAGNAGTAAIAALLGSQRERIEHFATQEETSVLILSIGTNAV